MHDYNGDGHHDSRDTSLFHNVIMDDSGNSKGSGGAYKGSSSPKDFSTLIILVIMMIFKPGALFSGFFRGSFGLFAW